MAKFRDLARTSVDAPPLFAPLEDKVAYIHHVLRIRAIGQPVARRNGVVGREVRVALKGVIRDTWPQPDAQLESLASLIRQVLKRIGGAVCVSSNKGETPVWFVSDELASDYVTVSRYVAVHGSTGTGGIEPTRRELKLTPHEAGEDREPAPVEVKNGTPKQKETTVVDLTTPTKDKLLKRADWLELVKLVFSDRKATLLSGYEIVEALSPLTGRTDGTIRGVLTDLMHDRAVYSRFENEDEHKARFPGLGMLERGRPARLFALNKKDLAGRHVAQHTPGVHGEPSRHVKAAKKTAAAPVTPTPVVPTPVTQPTDMGAVLEALVEAEVARRVGDLQGKLEAVTTERDELKKQLARVKRAMA
jgi:hypothetical protein